MLRQVYKIGSLIWICLLMGLDNATAQNDVHRGRKFDEKHMSAFVESDLMDVEHVDESLVFDDKIILPRSIITIYPVTAREDLKKFLPQSKQVSADHIGELKLLTEQNYTDAEAIKLLGDLYFLQGDFESSYQAYEKVVNLNYNPEWMMVHIALALERLERYKEALDILKYAIQLDPTLTDAYLAIGAINVKRGEYMDGVNSLDYALELREQSPDIMFWLGMAHYGLADYGQAVEYLRQTIASRNFFIEAYPALALALIKMDLVNEAIEILNKALKFNRDYLSTHLQLWDLYLQTYQYKNAKKHGVEAYRIYMKNRRYDEAKAMKEQLYSELPLPQRYNLLFILSKYD